MNVDTLAGKIFRKSRVPKKINKNDISNTLNKVLEYLENTRPINQAKITELRTIRNDDIEKAIFLIKNGYKYCLPNLQCFLFRGVSFLRVDYDDYPDETGGVMSPVEEANVRQLIIDDLIPEIESSQNIRQRSETLVPEPPTRIVRQQSETSLPTQQIIPETIQASIPAQPHVEIEECSICFDPLSDGPSVITQCGHKFHRSCINRWGIQRQCPICRHKPITPLIPYSHAGSKKRTIKTKKRTLKTKKHKRNKSKKY